VNDKVPVAIAGARPAQLNRRVASLRLRISSTGMAFFFLLLVANVYACDCAPARAIAEEAGSADAVFIGVPGAKSANIQREDGPFVAFMKRLFGAAPNYAPDDVFYEFTVSESLKGIRTGKQRVYTAHDSAACGCEFEPGVAYIVFAQRSGNELRTHLCTSTSRVDARSTLEMNQLRDVLGVPPDTSLERMRER
jgi:hypothetical protein